MAPRPQSQALLATPCASPQNPSWERRRWPAGSPLLPLWQMQPNRSHCSAASWLPPRIVGNSIPPSRTPHLARQEMRHPAWHSTTGIRLGALGNPPDASTRHRERERGQGRLDQSRLQAKASPGGPETRGAGAAILSASRQGKQAAAANRLPPPCSSQGGQEIWALAPDAEGWKRRP